LADVETDLRRLQVANLPPADSGRGIARVPSKVMDQLGLADGDVIEIVGKRTTPARAVRPYGDDEGLDIIVSTASSAPMPASARATSWRCARGSPRPRPA
jgi:hypothetical protein